MGALMLPTSRIAFSPGQQPADRKAHHFSPVTQPSFRETLLSNTLLPEDNSIHQERRRTVRIRRSGLRKQGLSSIAGPAIKFAETREELSQTFSLIHTVYRQKKFIKAPKPHGMLYSVFSLLPDTTHVIGKSYNQTISNLTVLFDSQAFGLPMDAIYKQELDDIRTQGRKVIELSSLATLREHRWKNIFNYLVQVMYWYAVYKDVDDVCIAVNPRHVRYYQNLYPFELFGPERMYPRVGAPAVGLRGRITEAMDRMKDICRDLEFDTPLDTYFERMNGTTPLPDIPPLDSQALGIIVQPNKISTATVQYFIDTDPSILDSLNGLQCRALQKAYPDLHLP